VSITITEELDPKILDAHEEFFQEQAETVKTWCPEVITENARVIALGLTNQLGLLLRTWEESETIVIENLAAGHASISGGSSTSAGPSTASLSASARLTRNQHFAASSAI
jgi:hypothetical protein